MKIKVKYLNHLISLLISKYDASGDRKGLEEIGETIGITREYLYKKVVNPISKLKGGDSIGLRDSIVKTLLGDVGFLSIGEFIRSIDYPVAGQVKSLIGSYYSYVRRNTKDGVLLRSPVRIYEKERRVFMELKGERWHYHGELILQKGIVSILLSNSEGKCFHHIYKVGSIENPKVVQGIFSGVTSAFDPIGGRVVLERRAEAFTDLRTSALDVDRLKNSRIRNDKILANYFGKYTDNNLSIGRTTTFEFADLE